MESTIQFIEVIKKHEAIYDTTNKDYKNMEKKANAWTNVSNEVGLSVEACKRKWKNLRDSYTKYLRSYRIGTKTSKKYQYWAHADHMDFLRPFQGPGRSQNIKLEDIYSEFASSINKNNNDASSSYDLNYEVLEKYSTENLRNTNLNMNNNNNNNNNNSAISSRRHQHNDSIISQNNDTTSTTSSLSVPIPSISSTRPMSMSTMMDTTATVISDVERNLIKQIELDATSMFFLSLAKSVRAMPRKYQNDLKMRCMKIVSDVEIELENSMYDLEDNNNSSNLSTNNNNRSLLLKNEKFNGNGNQNSSHSTNHHHQSQQQSLSQHQTDNSEHFLYVMSPSRVEAMIDISSDDEQTTDKI